MGTSDAVALREIRQHNAITTARYEMSACEMDIVFFLLSKLTRDDLPGTLYRLRLQELEQLTGRNWNYKRLVASTKLLTGRVYTIETEGTLLQVSLLASAFYQKGGGTLELEISERIRPYLIDLKNNFTSYRLQAAFNLTSKFAKRIYQLASQWKDVGESKVYSLSEFKNMLKLKDPTGKEKEQYIQVSALQKYVLDVGVEQVNEHTDLYISYELIKQGRSYESIRFYIKPQQPKQLPLPFELEVPDAKAKVANDHLDALKIVDPALRQRILETPAHLDTLFAFQYRMKTGQVKATRNPAGLLLKMMGLV